MTQICISNLTIIGSDNGLSPVRRQDIIWTNAGILLIGPLGTNFNEILIASHTFSFKKMRLKMFSAKWRPFCLGLNVLICGPRVLSYFTLSMAAITVMTWPKFGTDHVISDNCWYESCLPNRKPSHQQTLCWLHIDMNYSIHYILLSTHFSMEDRKLGTCWSTYWRVNTFIAMNFMRLSLSSSAWTSCLHIMQYGCYITKM